LPQTRSEIQHDAYSSPKAAAFKITAISLSVDILV